MSTPADELRAAAFQLRNPFHLPGLKVGIDPELGSALADWLEHEARYWANVYIGQPMPDRDHYALAVARQINAKP